jgi:aspartate aminotransferase
MIDSLKSIPKGDVVLFHGCCHNPTGGDLTQSQWRDVLEVTEKQGFLPFFDIAYQGFGDGIDEDAYAVRLFAERLPEIIIAASCSKNFGLYRERVGLAAIITESSALKNIAQSQIQNVARGIYSMPPSYGGALVNIVLSDAALKQEWIDEVDAMRDRMQSLRNMLVTSLEGKGASKDFSFVNEQKGMFSYLCISPEQVRQMRANHSVYFVDSSRVNIAGINQNNVEALADALISAL